MLRRFFGLFFALQEIPDRSLAATVSVALASGQGDVIKGLQELPRSAQKGAPVLRTTSNTVQAVGTRVISKRADPKYHKLPKAPGLKVPLRPPPKPKGGENHAEWNDPVTDEYYKFCKCSLTSATHAKLTEYL